MSSTNLRGKVCLVTGGSRGIGRGIALQLAKAGATVYLTGRNMEALIKCADEMRESCAAGDNKDIHPVQVDHANDDQVRQLFDQIKGEQGRLDILVNNAYAGVDYIFRNLDKSFWENDDPGVFWDRHNNVGLRNHFICSSYAARIMSEQKSGLIVNISSAGGLQYLFNVPYGVGKTAVDRMTQDTAHELKKHNVAVVSLWPGPVKTEIVQDIFINNDNAPKAFAGGDAQEAFSMGESVEFSGKAVVALGTSDEKAIMKKSGRVLLTSDLASEYGFTEDDGSLPMDIFSLKAALMQTPLRAISGFVPGFLKVPKIALYLAGFKF